MISVNTIIQNAVTRYTTNFSWTSASGGGTTKFQNVFNFMHLSHTDGQPFLCIDDTTGDFSDFTNMRLEGDVTLEFAVCFNWSTVDLTKLYTTQQLEGKSDSEKEALKMKEAMIRMREAWDAFKADIVKISTLDTIIGGQKSWMPAIGFSSENIDELSLFRRVVRITLKEYINRY